LILRLFSSVTRLLTAPADVTGFSLNRRHVFEGKWIKHGGRFPMRLLRVWRTGLARVEERWMDEHVVLSRGRMLDLNGAFYDWNLKDLTFFTAKRNGYAVREAIDVIVSKRAPHPPQADDHAHTAQAKFKRFLKQRVYNRMPTLLGPFAYFLYRYFLQLGFLDGKAGLKYHMLQGFWYRFLVACKIQEIEAQVGDASGDALFERLEALTGYSAEDIRRLTSPSP